MTPIDQLSGRRNVQRFFAIAIAIVLLNFSVIFYLERCLYLDLAFHTYAIIQAKWFTIQNHRFGAAITQVFPLIAAKIHLPLKVVLLFYSSSFYIYYLVVILSLIFWFKNEALALAFSLYMILLGSLVFFWAQSEYPQAVATAVFFIGFLLHYKHHILKLSWRTPIVVLLLLALGFVTIVFHPLVILPLCFCIGFYLLHGTVKWKEFIAIAVFVGVLYLTKKLVFPPAGYDNYKMDGLKNFGKLFPDYFTIPSTLSFVSELFRDYLIFYVLFLIVISYYFLTRHFRKASWVFGFALGYMLIVNVSFPDVTYNFYIQNLHLPLGLIIALPFAVDIVPRLKTYALVLGLLAICVPRFYSVYSAHSFYSNRIITLEKLLSKSKSFPTNRFLIGRGTLPAEFGDSWAISYETLLLSSLSSPDSARTIENYDVIERRYFSMEDDSSFLNPIWDQYHIPKEYFNLGKKKYKLLPPLD